MTATRCAHSALGSVCRSDGLAAARASVTHVRDAHQWCAGQGMGHGFLCDGGTDPSTSSVVRAPRTQGRMKMPLLTSEVGISIARPRCSIASCHLTSRSRTQADYDTDRVATSPTHRIPTVEIGSDAADYQCASERPDSTPCRRSQQFSQTIAHGPEQIAPAPADIGDNTRDGWISVVTLVAGSTDRPQPSTEEGYSPRI